LDKIQFTELRVKIIGSEALASPKSARLKSHFRNSDNLFVAEALSLNNDFPVKQFFAPLKA
jgi:hypothetical protein